MPFKQRGLAILRDWMADEDFDLEVDRLLLKTNWGDTFLAALDPNNSNRDSFIVDPTYMPENLALITMELRTQFGERGREAAKEPWHLKLYDGEMTASGPKLEMMAIGAGWSMPVRAGFGLVSITPVRVDELDSSQLVRIIDGVYFGQINVTWQVAARA